MARSHRSPRLAGGTLTGLVGVLAVLVLTAMLPAAHAGFSAVTTNADDAWAADWLLPPSGLTATYSCSATPIDFRNATQGTGLGILILPTPSGIRAGDFLVAQVTNATGPIPLTAPAGWNLIRRDSSNPAAPAASAVTSALFWRTVVDGEPATATFVLQNSMDMVGGIAAYRGVRVADPVNASGAAAGATATATTPSLTTTVVDTVLADFTTKAGEALPAPTGTTERWRLANLTSTLGTSAGDVPFDGPGATPTRSSVSPSGSLNEWVTQTVALRPRLQAAASLTWTASPSAWGTGYVLERMVGSTVQAERTLAPIATASAIESPLVNGTTYTFRLSAYRGAWRSPAVTTTLTPAC